MPLWEKANELGAVIYIHPAHPVGVEAMEKYWLMPLVGFLMDTTLAAGKLVFSGIVERFPRITWVLTHMGGAVPYLAERMDRGYEAFAECRANIKQKPSAYLKRFYYDTVNFDNAAQRLAIEFAGRRPHRGWQRLPAPDRKHPEDAVEHPRSHNHRRGARKDPRR